MTGDSGEATNPTPLGRVGLTKLRNFYWEDPVAYSSINVRLTGTIPGLQLLPRNATDEAKISADLIQAVSEDMPGSLLSVLRDEVLREAFLAGFAIAEPVFGKRVIWGRGAVIGLEAIRTRPAEGFEDGGIIQDVGGRIIEFVQTVSGEPRRGKPEQVIYYAHHGSPANPYGVSLLMAPVGWMALKEKLRRDYSVFATVNASGIRKGTIPDDRYDDEYAATLDKMKKLSSHASIVLPESYKLDLQIPPGTAGFHYINGIRELCNKEIRTAILLDETLNAEGMHTGSYASKKVSQSVVYEAYAAEGEAFCETIAEQLFRRILDLNGYNGYPIPRLIPEPPPKHDTDPAPILTALATARSAGIITQDIPEDVQRQLMQTMLGQVGVSYDIDIDVDSEDDHGDEETGSADTGADTPPAPTAATSVSGEGKDTHVKGDAHTGHDTRAAAPPTPKRPAPRMRDGLALAKVKVQQQRAEYEGQRALLDKWQELVPDIKDRINAALFDKHGNFRTRKPKAVKVALEGALKYRGKELKDVIASHASTSLEAGRKDAAAIMKAAPIKATIQTTGNLITPGLALDALDAHAQLYIAKTYADLESRIMMHISSSMLGYGTPQEAMTAVAEILQNAGIDPARAATIVNTSLADGYNQGRLLEFRNHEGKGPGQLGGYQYSAVIDEMTTDVCEEYNNRFFRSDDPSLPEPPLHYQCRSVLIPVFNGEELWGEIPEWTSYEKSAELKGRMGSGFNGAFRTTDLVTPNTPVAPPVIEKCMLNEEPLAGPKKDPTDFGWTDNREASWEYWRKQDGYKEWRASLTPDDVANINYYTGTGYEDLNIWLRTGEYPDFTDPTFLPEIRKGLTEALEKFTVDDPFVAYRGTSTGIFNYVPGYDGTLESIVGQVLTDPGFLSTSMNADVAMSFAHTAVKNNTDYVRVIVKIQVPEGAHGGFMGGDRILAYFSGESEFVMPTNTALRVTGISEIGVGGEDVIEIAAQLLL